MAEANLIYNSNYLNYCCWTFLLTFQQYSLIWEKRGPISHFFIRFCKGPRICIVLVYAPVLVLCGHFCKDLHFFYKMFIHFSLEQVSFIYNFNSCFSFAFNLLIHWAFEKNFAASTIHSEFYGENLCCFVVWLKFDILLWPWRGPIKCAAILSSEGGESSRRS